MKTVVIFTTVDPKNKKALSQIEEHLNLDNVKVRLVHLWSTESYSIEGHVAAFYPNKEQAKELSSKMEKELSGYFEAFKNLSSENFEVKVTTCSSPKREAVSYLKEAKADLAVCLTPSKDKLSDFFHSSFTNYLSSHAPCDMLVIRQK